MGETVTLVHALHKANRVEFLYDDLYLVQDGRVTVPTSRPEHLRALHFRGYNKGVNGEQLWTTQDLDLYIQATV